MSTLSGDALGSRIRDRREAIGMTQDELAKQMGFASRQTLSDLERGQRELKASELVRLAQSLRMDTAALLAGQTPASPHVLWRDPPETGAAILQADFLNWCERYAHVKRASGGCAGEASSWPSTSLAIANAGYKDAEALARRTADLLDLGARPASSLQRALETQLGVIIWFLDLGPDGSAACAKGDFGPSMLINRHEPPWRRNFDMAHELFHLITWETTCVEVEEDPGLADKAERLANAFAASLLLPADHLKAELRRCAHEGSVTLNDLITTARDFDVSTSALLWRMLNLGCGIDADQVRRLLSDPDFRRMDKASMVGVWWDPAPLPERFVWLAHLASVKGRLSRAKLAQYLGCGLAEVESRLEEFGVSETELGATIDFQCSEGSLDGFGGDDGATEVCLA